MTASGLFLIGLAATEITCFGVVWYLRQPLRSLLVELCGTDQRAAFWLAFSSVTLMLWPVIFAMHSVPDWKPGTSAIFALAGMVKWAFTGLLSAVLAMGLILNQFIKRMVRTS